MDLVQVEKAVKALGDKPTLKSFIEQFGVFVQGPGGIEGLRVLVLELAFSGKLCANSDGSSELLFEKISLFKENLIKKKILKKTKNQGEITPDEVRLTIPDTWRWVRLGDIFDVRDGTHDSPKYYDSGYPLVTSKNIYTGKLDLTNVKYISEEDHIKISERSKVDREDILFAMIGSIGNPVIIDVEPEFSVKNVGLFKYYDRELSNPTYLLNYLKLAETWFKEESSGAVQSFVSLGKLRIYPFPLAPLAEQKRIVAKIDELMALCDQLEVQQQQQANTLLKANTAAIHALLYADDGYSKKHKAGSQNKQYKKQENFKVAWERIANNFHTLYGNTLPMPPGEGRQKKYFVGLENVKQLRQMILNLAVIGHLTSKDKSDTPFSLYLDKLDTYCEKNNITRVKVRTGHLEEVDDIKLSLPEGWEYASLTQVAYFLGGGTPSKNISSFWGGNIPWVSPKDMKTDNIVDSELKITEIGLNSSTVKLIPVNSLLVVARSGILKRTLPVATNTIECTLNQDMKAIVPIKPELQPYIKLLLQGFTPFILKNLVKGGMTVQSLRYKEFEAFKFPFPPQEEQNRIVAKVDQLMVLCDQLEQQLTTAYGNVKKLTTTTLKALVV